MIFEQLNELFFFILNHDLGHILFMKIDVKLGHPIELLKFGCDELLGKIVPESYSLLFIDSFGPSYDSIFLLILFDLLLIEGNTFLFLLCNELKG